MARVCYRWVCKRLQANATSYHDHLIALKNSAYAWRQMVFYLSLQTDDTQRVFAAWAEEKLAEQPGAFCARFTPAVVGLRNAVERGTSPPRTPSAGGAMFLGWAKKRHWLVPAK